MTLATARVEFVWSPSHPAPDPVRNIEALLVVTVRRWSLSCGPLPL